MKRLALLLLSVSVICLQMNAQITTYNINCTITCTDTLQPFGTHDISYGLNIDGEGQLLSDTAFIRIVLVDNNDKEWLIYERNSLYSTEENNQFQNAAFETASLYNIVPSSIIVTLCDATLYLANIKNNKTYKDRGEVATMADSVFLTKNLQIVDRINAKLSTHKKAWRADTTFLSNLRYQERKAMFGDDMPNLQGWDYYAYGYYSTLNDNTPPASENIVKEFDWRTRHGSQNTGTYYYNSDGSGWIPRWRYGQGAGHPDCWAFSTLYSVESMVNLYFNQQINDELSVQDILSCSDGRPLGPGPGHGGVTDTALIYAAREGIVNDSCFGYITWHDTVPCEWKCSNPSEIVKIGGSVSNLFGEELVKSKVITKGPLVCSVIKWRHAMSMVGFGVVKAGDPVLYGTHTGHDFFVEEDSPDIGKPYYIFKQSYATYGYNHSHFCNVIIDANNGSYLKCRSIDTPITSMLYDDSDIVCVDNDGDGYYNWGIGPKPATCPNCPDEEDCDDSSPLIGPYDEKYECRILCENYSYSSTPEYITGQTLWGSETYIDHDVIVENGGVLTIESTIFMGESTKIIVKPGGRLILDYRAVLTGMCGNMWQGIEVWGNKNAHQYEINGSYQQGYLEMKNGAVIENAVCAVELWRPDHWSTTGGIIHATDATFRNNATSIHALCYTNHNPGNNKESGYNCVFKDCNFVIDEDYLGTETFTRHITLADVKGVGFTGCDFSVKRGVTGVNPWCMGINAYDAGFSVSSLCNSPIVYPCPEEYVKKSTFTGFCTGIKATSNGVHPRSFIVSNSVFTNNDNGIHANSTDFPTILMNEFTINKGTYCEESYGIYLDNVSTFCIEENSFQPVLSIGGSAIGIGIKDSKGVNDIYRNHFKNLSCGILSIGQNALASSSASSPGTVSGLTYSCNENEDNSNDFRVFQDNGTGGIQLQQGSISMPAGNTFDAIGYQFDNQGTNWIDYYYNNTATGQTPNPSKVNRVFLHSTSNANPCNTHYGNGVVDRSVSEKAALESDYLSSYTDYLDVKQLYENRIDGGSTATQVADINSATPSDMWQLRAQLLGLSPYVSGQVLTTAADRHDIFSDPVLFEILAANPDELKRDSLLNYLENKDNPLPSYMIDLLRQVASGATARTALVAQMNQLRHDYCLAAGDIVRSDLNDSLANPFELRNWLGNMNDIAADHMVISSYLQEGDSISAFALANMLPDLYELHDEGLVDHLDYMRLVQLYQTLIRTDRNVYQLTETETATVENIAENGLGPSQLMARNLLDQIADTNSETCLDSGVPDMMEGRGRTYFDDHLRNKAVGFTVNVSPNPATTWTTVEYTLPSIETKALLTLTNTLGVNTLSSELAGIQGSKVLDLRPLAAGVYVYTIQCGQYLETGKLVITK